MSSSVEVAVVIPAYNAEPFIEQTLASLMAQTIKPSEAIVVDDGSTDDTSARVQEVSSRSTEFPIRLITQPNKGPGAARNTGVHNATSDYIAFLDADDFWYPHKLERVINAIREHPEADVFCHDEYLRSVHGSIKRRVRVGPAAQDMYEYLLFKHNSVLTSAVVLRTEAFHAVGGFSEDRAFDSNEDWDLWLRLARANYRFFFLPEVLGEWILGPQGLTLSTERHFETELNVLKRHFEWSEALQSDPKKCQRRLALALYGKARGYYKNKNYHRAFLSYLECIQKDPLFLKPYLGMAVLLCRLPI